MTVTRIGGIDYRISYQNEATVVIIPVKNKNYSDEKIQTLIQDLQLSVKKDGIHVKRSTWDTILPAYRSYLRQTGQTASFEQYQLQKQNLIK